MTQKKKMPLRISDHLQTDERLQEGEWITLTSVPLRVLVAKAMNSRFVRRLDRLRAPYTKRGRDVPPEMDRKLTRKAASEYLWLDFEGPVIITNENGEDEQVESTPEVRERMLEIYPDLAIEITDHATMMAEVEGAEEKMAGNS